MQGIVQTLESNMSAKWSYSPCILSSLGDLYTKVLDVKELDEYTWLTHPNLSLLKSFKPTTWTILLGISLVVLGVKYIGSKKMRFIVLLLPKCWINDVVYRKDPSILWLRQSESCMVVYTIHHVAFCVL